MIYSEAEVLAVNAVEFTPALELTVADIALLERFIGDEYSDEYEYNAYESEGFRLLVGVDGDAYIIDSTNVYYLATESCLGHDEYAELPFEAR
jgi:hypothetical protein